MISKEEVLHTATLARLKLGKAEVGKYRKELSAILDYFEKLKEVDVTNVNPMTHSVVLENVMRSDEIAVEKPETKKQLVDMVPSKKDRYVKVKAVL